MRRVSLIGLALAAPVAFTAVNSAALADPQTQSANPSTAPQDFSALADPVSAYAPKDAYAKATKPKVDCKSYDETIQFIQSLIDKAKLERTERYEVLEKLKLMTPTNRRFSMVSVG